jgi:glutamate/tyrosine decarboxylase-like PLP-dependent enzyme
VRAFFVPIYLFQMFKKSLILQEQNFEITFPNAGQVLDIWNAQMMLSENRYAEMARQRTRLSSFMIDAIDAIATFSILVPGIAQQLNAKTITDIDPKQLKLLVGVYRKQFAPWYNALVAEMLEEEEEVELVAKRTDDFTESGDEDDAETAA